MSVASLLDQFPLLAAAPEGVKRLRELILVLAVRGKLVPQDPNDEPASELLKRIQAEKAKLLAEGKIKSKPLREIGKDEGPFELPDGWEWTALAIVSLVNPRNDIATDTDASFVPMAMIGSRFDGAHQQEQRKWSEIKQGFTHFAEGDVGVAKITPCFENSKACVFSGLQNGIGAGTTELHIIRPVANTLAPRYVLAYVKAPMFLQVGESRMTGTAGQKRLPKDFVETNPFPLPPLAEQRRIVAKVDELMALCDRLEAQQADAASAHTTLVKTLLDTLTQSQSAADFAANWQRLAQHFDTLFTTEASIAALKQTLLQLAVMGKLVVQDPNDEPASELLKRIQAEKAKLVTEGRIKKDKPLPEIGEDEKPFELPEGWEWARLGEVGEVGSSSRVHQKDWTSHGVPFYRAREIVQLSNFGFVDNELFIDESLFASLSMQRGMVPEAGDLMITGVGTIGVPYIVKQADKFYFKDASVLIFKNYFGMCPAYLFLLLRSPHWIDTIHAKSMGTTVHTLTIGRANETPLPLPPLPEQDRIVAKVDELIALCDQLAVRLKAARELAAQYATASTEAALQAA